MTILNPSPPHRHRTNGRDSVCLDCRMWLPNLNIWLTPYNRSIRLEGGDSDDDKAPEE